MKLYYIDLFCGAGGTSTGVNTAIHEGNRCAEVVCCVNHDKNAILSHESNHPDALHYTEDIRTLELGPMSELVKKIRADESSAVIVLWASLECTNFSKAKGGMPRDADSRTLAEHLYRYIETINPDYIQIENVEEFMSWGDMINGKPISRDKGRCYLRWINKIKKYGYDFDYRIMNAADYGAYTSRKRFYGIFARNELPIVFPDPTHCKDGSKDLFGNLAKWKPVKEVLDFSDEGKTIFREKPLSEKTLERIYHGLLKFVAGGKQNFLIKWNSMNRKGKYKAPDMEEPCPTVAAQNRLGIAKVSFLSKQYSGHPESKNSSIDAPAGTITCIDHHALITTTKNFLMNPQYSSAGGDVNKPCFTLIARMDKMPPYLVGLKDGKSSKMTINPDDSEMTIKIKEFMQLYDIADIKMRMLKIEELKRIMGFPEDYVLVGTKAEQMKYIGNAVEVNVARCWCEALYTSLYERMSLIA